MSEAQIPTLGSRALSRILDENGPAAKRVRERFDKALLWRASTGRRVPNPDTMALLAHYTGAKVLGHARAWIPRDRWLRLVKV